MKKYMSPVFRSVFVFSLLAILTTFGMAQVIYIPYYGKNKIMYDKFDWNHYKTDHFDIYYYVEDLQILEKVAALAESAYHRLSRDLKHELSATVPILFYVTTTDYEQTNLFNSAGTLGAAESVLYRIILQGDMPTDELQDLFEHELTHIFEYDLLWGNPGGSLYAVSQPPGWITEGFAEYNTRNWSTWSEIIVRDAVLSDRIPELNSAGHLFSRYPSLRPPDYDFGHAIFDFIEHKHGKQGITELWQSMKGSPLIGRINPIKRVFNQTIDEFNHDFKKYLRAKFRDYLLRENPEDYSHPIGPEYPLNPFFFSFSHALSPSGDIVAILTQNLKELDLDILFVSTRDGSVIKNITRGHTTQYELIQFVTDPTLGSVVDWSPDGDKIAFFARAGEKHTLFVLDVLTGRNLYKIKIPYDQPTAPSFLKNSKEILFTAFHNNEHDIFRLNLETEKYLNLTSNDLFEKAPSVSPDGKSVAYTIRIDTYDKLFISPIEDLSQKTQITFGRGNTVTPSFSHDSKTIYFSGDMRGAFNIYSIDLDSGELKIYTDVRTGNFQPVPFPNGPNEVLFSSFNKGAFQVFKSELEGEVEKTVSFAEVETDEEFQRFEPIVTVEINKDEIKAYKGLGKLYLTSRPPIDTILSTDGSIYGGSAISFSDLLGDYTFHLMAYQVRNFRSYYFAFINQKARLQYQASAFQYTMFYYPDYVYYDPTLWQFMNYRDAIATRKITGANISAFYPFSRYYRAEGTLGFLNYEEDFFDPYLTQMLLSQGAGFGGFLNGSALSASFALTGETTRFNYFGPVSGHTFRVALTQAIPVSESFIKNTTVQFDARKYLNISSNALFAARLYGFASRGENPYIFYFGGNNEIRSVYYYSLIGNEGWYANFEFRFPILNSATSAIGQLGPVRGTLFFDIGRTKLKGFPPKLYRYPDNPFDPLIEFDAIGSYGFGFQFFFLGFPIHLDLVKRLEFPDINKPLDVNVIGKFKLKLWIGYDF
ncbi:MAG: hypothetical protein PVF22_01205 [Candidatus Aminicenantes bacterium]|jgi:hypothetical protein